MVIALADAGAAATIRNSNCWQACPQLGRADIMAERVDSGFDPGWVKTRIILLFDHNYLPPILSSRVGLLDNFRDRFCSSPS